MNTEINLEEVKRLHRMWCMGEPSGERANLRGADLRGADLRGADLQDADLRGAYLQDADLRGADLRGANLRDADLQGANLRGADLQGAYLWGADLLGANLQGADLQGADLGPVKVSVCAAFNGLYYYIVMPVIAEDGTEWIRLGCHFRKASDWAEYFWNNPREFPNTGDIASKDRWNAYQTCVRWLEDHRDESNGLNPSTTESHK